MILDYIVGIDEVGRGPIAGPVAVGAVIFKRKGAQGKLQKMFADARDSKKLSEKKREAVYEKMVHAKKEGLLDFAVSSVSNTVIDSKGIVPAIRRALRQSLDALTSLPEHTQVLLDGGLQAPKEFVHQKTIIKGDSKELAIMLAAIAAKVRRDRYMVRLSEVYPHYGFERHKGYGTKAHYEALEKYGICKVHRRSFLTKT